MSEYEETATDTISDAFFENIREEKREKPVFENIVDAQITAVSEAKYNPINGEGQNKKDGRKYKKFFFYITYLYTDKDGKPQETSEAYGFRFYEDNKTIWFGTEKSSCGLLISKLKKYTPGLPEKLSFIDVKKALIDRKVKIYTAEFGVSKSKKIMIDTFL